MSQDIVWHSYVPSYGGGPWPRVHVFFETNADRLEVTAVDMHMPLDQRSVQVSWRGRGDSGQFEDHPVQLEPEDARALAAAILAAADIVEDIKPPAKKRAADKKAAT